MNEISSPTLTQEEEYVWVEDLRLPMPTGYAVLAKGYVTKLGEDCFVMTGEGGCDIVFYYQFNKQSDLRMDHLVEQVYVLGIVSGEYSVQVVCLEKLIWRSRAIEAEVEEEHWFREWLDKSRGIKDWIDECNRCAEHWIDECNRGVGRD
ncbi:uncharacterized protein SCHCODRAFT_02494352 [Schizophyllum commune H4-8]|uniref:uncharacterized protein n=1 Tax=Schizophyllum commune (strain H4-8 / FGSC 9210) TaxID=578458 RepID=UPI00215E8455|nr:uncharacterized protein SCHCODRAFT_02494352 [Schizophyllum commune H4-8]KAI5895601.1 hypothetical protein SCHCODRAFT_02494352 [Schizophyllum commune H4-8]